MQPETAAGARLAAAALFPVAAVAAADRAVEAPDPDFAVAAPGDDAATEGHADV